MTAFVPLGSIPAPLLAPGWWRFAISIAALSVVQAAVVALPSARRLPVLERLRSGWWALIPAGSVVAFVFGVRALGDAANGLTYLALVAVPPLAALALGWLVRGARPVLALAAVPLFALAWADRQGVPGELAGVALDALSCVALGVLLVAVTPRLLAKLAIVVMAATDAWVVATNLLAAPNNALNAVVPVAHLPQLQSETLYRAVMGYGDLFVAGLLGALLAREPAVQRRGARIAAIVALAFDLLFLVVDQLPATVPIALTLLCLELEAARRRRTPPTVASGQRSG
ncbi:MAG: hypothetical protein ABSC56_08645 [Solirubrobacteraceae bacterium]|jgi:hypothetical protein